MLSVFTPPVSPSGLGLRSIILGLMDEKQQESVEELVILFSDFWCSLALSMGSKRLIAHRTIKLAVCFFSLSKWRRRKGKRVERDQNRDLGFARYYFGSFKVEMKAYVSILEQWHSYVSLFVLFHSGKDRQFSSIRGRWISFPRDCSQNANGFFHWSKCIILSPCHGNLMGLLIDFCINWSLIPSFLQLFICIHHKSLKN